MRRRILVTGATGFVGQYVTRELKRLGEVVPLGRKKIHTSDIIFDLTHQPTQSDRTKLPFSVDAVVHLAALTQKTKNDRTSPEEYLLQNVLGTGNLLDLLDKTLIKQFIYVSTHDVYGDANGEPITEETASNPQTPYAKSKYEAEQLCAEWAARRGIPFCIARLGLVYGPGEEAYEKVIPQYIRMALNGQPLEVFGNGEVTRDFIYVTDAACAIRVLIENKAIGVYNIVSGETVMIEDLAKYINKLTGNPAGIRFAQAAGNQMNICFDTTKLQRLGFVPKTSVKKGLSQEISWFKKHL